MALTGHLSDLSLSELIEFFCNQRKTGQLKVLYPQGHGSFYLHSGSVVDARIGVLRGIDAVYYSLTLPSAKFEFCGTLEAPERTINQPWTQVVLEGLRRLDEGVVPASAFPENYHDVEHNQQDPNDKAESPEPFTDIANLRVPGFLSFVDRESLTKRKSLVAGGVAVAVLLSVAAIGVPAGWYGRPPSPTPAVVSQPSTPEVAVTQPAVVEAPVTEAPEPTDNQAALAAKRQRDKDKAAAAREERLAAQSNAALHPVAAVPAPANQTTQAAKPGAKKVTVTVTYDESGRVTQASGGDASAVRIARQKRFPAGKAGSATITIPIN